MSPTDSSVRKIAEREWRQEAEVERKPVPEWGREEEPIGFAYGTEIHDARERGDYVAHAESERHGANPPNAAAESIEADDHDDHQETETDTARSRRPSRRCHRRNLSYRPG